MHFSWCLLCTWWGAKRQSREMKSPSEVSTNWCCNLCNLTHSCWQKLPEISQTKVQITMSGKRQFMNLKTDEVRGSICVLQKSLMDIWIQKLSENSQMVVPVTEYDMASVKAVLTMSQSVAGFMPVSLWMQDSNGVALSIIELCEVFWILPNTASQLMKPLSLGHIGFWKKGERAARKSRPSHDQYLAPCNTPEWRKWWGESCEGCKGSQRRY